MRLLVLVAAICLPRGTVGAPPTPPSTPLSSPPLSSASAACQQLGHQDALLILDVQNAFMEARPIRPQATPSYNVPAVDGFIAQGNLSVPDSGAIIDVINAWLSLRNSSGRNASVIATLDYHPPDHCSFCNSHEGGIPAGSFCLFGAHTWSTGDTGDTLGSTANNNSHVCEDTVSQTAFSQNGYYQWPFHAIAGSLSARFDPYLDLPDDTVAFKLGTQLMEDNYDALDGARRSLAPAGQHDSQPSALDLLDDPAHDLTAELEIRGVKRLFVFGLATDYVVGETVKHALGLSDYTAPLLGGQVLLVADGTRAILSHLGEAVTDAVDKRSRYVDKYITTNSNLTDDPDGYVIKVSGASEGLLELCSRGLGTCEDSAQCQSALNREYYCRPLAAFDWGECAACRDVDQSVVDLGAICHGHGTCTDNGACSCDLLYYGGACAYGGPVVVAAVASTVTLFVACCVLVIATRMCTRRRSLGLRVEKTGLLPVLSLAEGHRYHLFLSHIWATGQDQVAVIKRRLATLLPGASIFLDVDDLLSADNLEASAYDLPASSNAAHIAESTVVLVFLSAGYFKSRNCLRELRAALKEEKPLLLVHESNPSKGGAPLEQLQQECPLELRDAVFGPPPPDQRLSGDHGAMRIVPWHRLNRFQLESLRLIAEATLSHTPHYRKKGRSPRLYFPERSDPADYEFHFPTPAVLHASQHNPGAAHVAELLAARVDNLDCPQQSRPLLETFERLRKESHSSGSSLSRMHSFRSASRARQFLLLYLNADTFVGEAGDALEMEVHAAISAGVEVVVLHEKDPGAGSVPFEHFLQVTPEQLVRAGLYRALATPWFPGPHARVSLATAAQAMGASKRKKGHGQAARSRCSASTPGGGSVPADLLAGL
ncbi:hypothetical protein EMIHUDRAFT_239574 [Emiliania huxleyi CCMP1516]|uniref:EGF-like domain-containing protein n=2 Tax=Emiliania huxleyi TaxID=2903 RepID=A0A0D3JIZ9_EMIH1|nr:hypothetical protein EMIHUDRAFT_239574 [Emiliania huxleyi CCMP1516]EOD23484.1 hypothetical protein EMIHUDRAFT_239574 [Emiliania huxleyi CCMP1516]|eukprot:XP_005775913.1 hypothetical protein EMIHUDRAFT_239574 [Emiliania huxleyi CCMP1516]